jgi:hypothetical protein
MFYLATFFMFSMGLVLLSLWYSIQARWREGMWLVWLMSMLIMPTGLKYIPTGGFIVNFPMVAGVACLIGYLVSPAPLPRYRFMLSDVAAVLAPLMSIASMLSHGDLTPMAIPSELTRWLLPYYMGRIFLSSSADIPKISRIVARICLLNAFLGVFEAFSHISLTTKLLGIWSIPEAERMGLTRAHNFFNHPIGMGQVMLLMLPWCIEASRKRGRKGVRRLFYPAINFVAICSTLTRGAILGFFEALYLDFYSRSRYRAFMGVALAIFAVVVVLGEDFAISALASMAGEDETGTQIVMIQGEPHMYNSARHRMLQYKIFASGLDSAGLLGLGPMGLQHYMSINNVSFIFSRSLDSHYILSTLITGYGFLWSFHLITVLMIYRFGKVAWAKTGPYALLASGLFGASIVGAIAWLSTYLTWDICVVYIFYSGLACNVELLDRESRRTARHELISAPTNVGGPA